ncbi:hypothetical protein GUJ93_ZPchr0006g43575 [Zizania palustris]|uniref:TMEM62 C-terminal domain-containing protein n=1 Tax=Zizania palustris TaxID=103762 RepID=A0A8J5T4S2_ZIZPA|nr:hypothetical protein GUJ93_ZPchr0006g43575 [Zizania palustris]
MPSLSKDLTWNKQSNPDVLVITLPFLYLVVAPVVVVIYSLFAENAVACLRHSRRAEGRVDTTNANTESGHLLPGAPGPGSLANLSDKKILSVVIKFCGGWTRRVLLLLCCIIAGIHLKLSSRLMSAYGAKPNYYLPNKLDVARKMLGFYGCIPAYCELKFMKHNSTLLTKVVTVRTKTGKTHPHKSPFGAAAGRLGDGASIHSTPVAQELVGELRLEIVVHDPLDAGKDVQRQPIDKAENDALPVRRKARPLRSNAWSAGVHHHLLDRMSTSRMRPVPNSGDAARRTMVGEIGSAALPAARFTSTVCITPKLAPMIQLCACRFGWPNDFYNYHIIKAGNAAMLVQHERKRLSGQQAK